MTGMLVKCDHCGAEFNVSAAGSLRGGWPTCCKGHTMRLISTKEFIAAVEGGAVARAVGPIPRP